MNAEKQNLHSYAMDGLKLLFITIIVVHHSGFLRSVLFHGYMGVDFFFMVSGYMLYRTLCVKPELSTGRYFVGRIRKMYPHYFYSFVVMLVAVSVYRSGGLSFQTLVNALPEMLLVQNLGIFGGGVNYPCWYMSVLIFASMLVFFLGRKLPGWVFNCLGLFCAAVSYGYILLFTGGSMETFATVGMFYLPFWRGMAGLFIGSILYQLHERLNLLFDKHYKGFRILELVSLGFATGLMLVPGKVDGIILVLLMLLLAAVGSEKSVINATSDCRAVRAGVRYEYAVFLNHAFVIGIFGKLIGDRLALPAGVELAALLIILVGYSVLTETMVSGAVKKLRLDRIKV